MWGQDFMMTMMSWQLIHKVMLYFKFFTRLHCSGNKLIIVNLMKVMHSANIQKMRYAAQLLQCVGIRFTVGLTVCCDHTMLQTKMTHVC